MAHTTGMIPGIYKVWQNRWHIPANKGYNGGRRPVSSPGFSDLSIASKIRGLVLIAPMCAKDRATRFHKQQVWYVNIIIIELFVTRPTRTISHQSIYFSIHPGQGLGSRVKRHQFSKKAGNHLNLTLPLDVYKWNNSSCDRLIHWSRAIHRNGDSMPSRTVAIPSSQLSSLSIVNCQVWQDARGGGRLFTQCTLL